MKLLTFVVALVLAWIFGEHVLMIRVKATGTRRRKTTVAYARGVPLPRNRHEARAAAKSLALAIRRVMKDRYSAIRRTRVSLAKAADLWYLYATAAGLVYRLRLRMKIWFAWRRAMHALPQLR